MLRQKAQGIVEFALIIPLFMLFFLGIVTFGFFFSDYLTMSNTVRSVAHDASLKANDEDYKKVIINNVSGVALFTDMFTWQPDSTNGTNNDYLKVIFNEDTKNVDVTATAPLNNDSSLATMLNNMPGVDIKKLEIKYSMYSAERAKSSN